MKKSIPLLIILFGIISCKKEIQITNKTILKKQSEAAFNVLHKADWLIGQWQNNSKSGNLKETWTKANDSIFEAKAYFIAGKDTVFSEFIQLTEKNKKLFYIATVYGQNEEKPTEFELTAASSTQLVFENPQHDFPQKIVYNKIGNDSLVVEISGIKDGKEKKEQFKMRKK